MEISVSDLADIAGEEIEVHTRAILARRVRFEGISRTHCRECDSEIPELRRTLLAGVELCVTCQLVAERKA